jgi:hypothetical protein
MKHNISSKNKQGINGFKVYRDKGMFQSDSMSPPIFRTALIPLGRELSRSNCGYQLYETERKISNFLQHGWPEANIDISEKELRNEIRVTKTISNVIKMEFILEKCASDSV